MTDPDTYRADLITAVESFEYELCADCEQDVDAHVFAPDPLGNPHVYCMTDIVLASRNDE